MKLLSLFVALAATIPLLPLSPAQACGGFFCNRSTPVNQAAERIIFSQADDGSVTAVIQIQYQGPAEEFAWMLPVNGSPDIAVSSNDVFSRLQDATNPNYVLNSTIEGDCADPFSSGGVRFDASAGPSADAGVAGPPPVSVVNRGSVGPYDFVIISVAEGESDPGQRAVEWLRENDYDVNELGVDRLTPYLAGGMNLLSFRLTKGNSAGTIRPVILSFGRGNPSIPLRPTAAAATDDMGVMVWVLGEHRAVPENYMSLELNEALINWTNPGSNYNDVVTRAANEAGGQGFVTEFAGAAAPFAEGVYPSQIRADFAQASVLEDWEAREGELLERYIANFGRLDGFLSVVSESIPLPADITPQEFLSCPFWCDYLDLSTPDIEGFEPSVFVDSLQAQVIQPLVDTLELFEGRDYLTRMYTTMSAHEMTRDPVFSFNADLPDYSNQHIAEQTVFCSPSVTRSEAPYVVTLPDGNRVRGVGFTWPFDARRDELPANRMIRRVGPEGEGEVVEDNRGAIADRLRSNNRVQQQARSSMGCTVEPGQSPAPLGLLGLALIGAVALIRRRSR